MLSDTNAPKYHTKASHAKDSARKPVFFFTHKTLHLDRIKSTKYKQKKMRYNICNASRGGLKRWETSKMHLSEYHLIIMITSFLYHIKYKHFTLIFYCSIPFLLANCKQEFRRYSCANDKTLHI